MTVKKLIEMLQDADPNLPVYVCVQNEGMFAFKEACEGETGETDLGPPPEDVYSKEQARFELSKMKNQMKVFAILPHGFGEEEPDHEADYTKN